MSLATPVKEGKRKRKSVDTPSQSQDSKRLKSQEAEPAQESSSTPRPKDTKTPTAPQPFSNNTLTKSVQKKIAMESTEKPFPNPQNQGQTRSNQAWKKQNTYRKMQARTQTEKDKNGNAVEEKGEAEAAEDAGEKKPKREKKQKVDKRKKKTDDDKAESEVLIEAEVVKQEDVPVEPSKEVAVKKAKEPKEDRRSSKPKKDIVTKKKEKKEKKKKNMVKTEEKNNEDVELDFAPRGLTVERTVANRGNWASSKPVGGHFITHDPVFSADEK